MDQSGDALCVGVEDVGKHLGDVGRVALGKHDDRGLAMVRVQWKMESKAKACTISLDAQRRRYAQRQRYAQKRRYDQRQRDT